MVPLTNCLSVAKLLVLVLINYNAVKQNIIMTDSLLFQIQIVNNVRLVNKVHYCVEENYMTIFSSFSANFPYHTILEINCVHASNWFTHLPPT